jgi:hypothetical protein
MADMFHVNGAYALIAGCGHFGLEERISPNPANSSPTPLGPLAMPMSMSYRGRRLAENTWNLRKIFSGKSYWSTDVRTRESTIRGEPMSAHKKNRRLAPPVITAVQLAAYWIVSTIPAARLDTVASLT